MRNKGLLAAVGAGAAAMYLLDPRAGRRRTRRVRDGAASFARDTGTALARATRDTAHRVRGLRARAERSLRAGTAPDEVVEERVRAALGRVVSHPHAIRAAAEAGCVTLQGPVLASEAGSLVAAVCRVRGVEKVIDRLEVHETPEGIPALRGGRPRRRRRRSWPVSARLAVSAAGGGLVAWGAVRRRWTGAAAAAAGAGLLGRGLLDRGLAGLTRIAPGARPVDVWRTVTVAAPRDHAFALWTRYENFPRFLSGVLEVRDLGGGRSRWKVPAPAGTAVGWDARITNYVPGRLIAWQSLRRAAVRNAATIRFEDAPEGGTRVGIHITYEPPGGALGHLAAMLFGTDPRSRMDEDLARMKAFVETSHRSSQSGG